MERSGSTPSALRRASLPGGSGTGGAPTAAAESHRCWTGAGHMYVLVCIGLPFAADFGPGLERASEGREAGRGVAFYASRRRLRAWPGGGGAHSWTEVFLSTPLYTSRRRLRAWPGGVGGGARNWTGNSRSTPLVADFGPGPNGAAGGAQLDAEFAFHAPRRQLRAWPAPLRCELNLLGRTCGAGKNICKNFKCNNKEYTSYYFNISINRQTH